MSYDSKIHQVFTDIVLVPNFVTAALTGAERAYCLFLFQETQSATIVQRKFCTQYGKDPPSKPMIRILATKHLSNVIEVRDFLNMRFPGRWIGHGGPTTWPSQSPV